MFEMKGSVGVDRLCRGQLLKAMSATTDIKHQRNCWQSSCIVGNVVSMFSTSKKNLWNKKIG